MHVSPTRLRAVLLLLGLLALPVLFWLLPPDGGPCCPSGCLFGLDPARCAPLLALRHFHSFHFEEALYHFPFVPLLYSLVLLSWLYGLRLALRELRALRS